MRRSKSIEKKFSSGTIISEQPILTGTKQEHDDVATRIKRQCGRSEVSITFDIIVMNPGSRCIKLCNHLCRTSAIHSLVQPPLPFLFSLEAFTNWVQKIFTDLKVGIQAVVPLSKHEALSDPGSETFEDMIAGMLVCSPCT